MHAMVALQNDSACSSMSWHCGTSASVVSALSVIASTTPVSPTVIPTVVSAPSVIVPTLVVAPPTVSIVVAPVIAAAVVPPITHIVAPTTLRVLNRRKSNGMRDEIRDGGGGTREVVNASVECSTLLKARTTHLLISVVIRILWIQYVNDTDKLSGVPGRAARRDINKSPRGRPNKRVVSGSLRVQGWDDV